jgi:hypothetical protein
MNNAGTAEVVVLGQAQREIDRPLTATEIRAGVNLIQDVMRSVMKEGVHFGTIPGTPKPTLYKAGAEKICSTFRIAIEPIAEDLSTSDESRYRVTARALTQSGVHLGSGIGECSSNEAKYRWRAPVCDEEFEETPEDRRRKVWKRGQKGGYQQKQIRTEPADVANTILKMATKRAMIAVTLQVTAASDIFAQDIEDLPEELQREIAREDGGTVAGEAAFADRASAWSRSAWQRPARRRTATRTRSTSSSSPTTTTTRRSTTAWPTSRRPLARRVRRFPSPTRTERRAES